MYNYISLAQNNGIFISDELCEKIGKLNDLDDKNCFSAYIVSDNLRKGASSNAVQILEYLIKENKK